MLVGALVWSIGLSLGATTGYAINPARDLGPRIAHALLPIAGKSDSDWSYSWVPVLGPVAGAALSRRFRPHQRHVNETPRYLSIRGVSFRQREVAEPIRPRHSSTCRAVPSESLSG